MRKLRLFFKAVFLFLKEGSLTWNNSELDWTEQDALSLGHYLGTTSGKHLAARLRFASLEHNRTAVQDGKKHRCGIATGYMLAVNDIQLLSSSAIDSPAQASEGTNDNVVSFGETAGLSHLSP
jgi:hypothetical protein